MTKLTKPEKPQCKDFIILNEEAIIADGYDIEEYKEAVDEIFAEYDCYKNEEGMYCGSWKDIGEAGSELADEEWFKLRHVKKWGGYTINNDGVSYHSSGDTIEAILKYFPERKAELL